MNRKFIVVDHGHHGVEMHIGARLGDIDGEHALDARLLANQPLGERLHRVRIGALRNADRDRLRREHEHIPALDGERIGSRVQHRRVLVERVMRKKIVSEERLPRAHGVCHARDADPAVDHEERIAREIEVWHGIDIEWIRIVDIIYQMMLPALAKVALAHAAHHA